ncbi:hypothetical protein THRCLA_21104 [Thraustotheca clavata]|uniref:Uncharacterized protein n=1 Tax=Thraustotheca clavata TaxID=74557 RepID=A0A1W0A099_9STRA|nr:hypothetical protein THRCLA_21104 [Thraustotheca clavata]
MSLEERLCNAFTLNEAIPELNEYLASIQIDDENPGFVLSWNLTSLNAFLVEENNQNQVLVPYWMRARPPNLTPKSFTDDLVHELQSMAGGQRGRVLLAPNTMQQYIAIIMHLVSKIVILCKRFLIWHLPFPQCGTISRHDKQLDSYKVQSLVVKNLPYPHRYGQRLRRLFV